MSEPIDVGSRRELFVDDLLVDTLDGAELALRHPERLDISLTADAPWEDNVALYSSIVQDGGVVRLQYRAGIFDMSAEDQNSVAALAESTDGGLTFQRPEVGLCEWEGSRRNNILQIGGVPNIPPAFIDRNPDCPEDRRYKGLASELGKLYVLSSSDGIRWDQMLDGPVKMTGMFDTINTAFWDPVAECYRSFTRYFDDPTPELATAAHGVSPNGIRCIQSSTSPDFIHWSEPVPHVYRDGIRDMQLYTNATVPCPGAEHILLSFPMRYMEQRTAIASHPNPGVSDSVFMASRDGVNWTRYGEGWVRPGLDPANWTERNNIPVWGIVQTSDTEWSMYISEHYRQPDMPGRMRRLSIPPHRFVSLHAGYRGGECVTNPLTFDGRELRINFATSAIGSVQVELQDERGTPIDGFALADMEPIYGDELDRPVGWTGGDLSRVARQPVRLRFVLSDADVWAWRLAR